VVEGPLGDVFENAFVLLIDDLVDLVKQGGAVQELGVVRSSRRHNFTRFIDDGFDVLCTGALVLRLDMEHHTLVFDVGVVSGHCLQFYPMDVVYGKVSSRSSRALLPFPYGRSKR
jgi:hypothetical protein